MALSKIKSDSIDSIDAAKIPNLDASKIATGTVDNARITLDAAEIPNLDAAKVTTGTFNTARISETSVTQHVTATDLTPVKNDVSLLALQNAINGNLSAYGLKNSWIEQFENSTYIENLTTCARDSSEYISSVSAGGPAIDAYDKLILHSDGGSSTSFTDSSPSGHVISAFGAVNHSTNSPAGKFGSTSIHFDGTTDYLSLPSHADWVFGTGDFTLDFWYRSTDSGDRVIVGSTSTGSATPTAWRAKSTWLLKFGSSHTDNFSGTATISQSVFQHIAYTRASGVLRVFINGVQDGSDTALTTNFSDQRELWIGNAHDGGDLHGYIDEMRISKGIARWTANFTPPTGAYGSTVVNATGSFESTDVVPQDVTNKSSVGLVILYKDQAGTTTFNGANELVAKVRANTGQAYQEVVLAGAGTYSDGLKIAIAPAIAVTAGQALSYQISFAGQSASLETRVHGVAMTY